MFLKTSIDKKKKEIEIEKICGKSYSLFYKLKQNLYGSPRYKIISMHPDLVGLRKSNDSLYYNLELRKKGVVLYFRYIQDEYAICGRYNQTMFQSSNKLFDIQIENYLVKAQIENLKGHNKFMSNFFKLKNENITSKLD